MMVAYLGMNTRFISFLAFCFAASSTTFADFEPFPPTPPGQPYSNEVAHQTLSNYSDLAWEMYSDSVRAIIRFNMAIYAFRKDPGPESFEEAKRLWIQARKVYGKTEAFRFSETAIDELELEIFINAWPVDESYIDYTRSDPNSGIINHPEQYPKLNSVSIPKLNEAGGEANIATGWHAIEFLLWGQDFNADGPGERSWTDYTTAPNADRRMTYLVTITEVLRFHLVAIADSWSPFNYDGTPGEFFLRRPSRIIRTVLRGLSALAGREIASERLATALRSRSQEDEHSCFSDTTHNDLVSNMEGIESVLFGTFTSASGKVVIEEAGFYDLIATADSEIAENVKNQFHNAQKLISAIPTPFDQSVMAEEGGPERQAIQTAVAAVWEFVYTLSDAEEAMQLSAKGR
jgi:putative iron-regulated protein